MREFVLVEKVWDAGWRGDGSDGALRLLHRWARKLVRLAGEFAEKLFVGWRRKSERKEVPNICRSGVNTSRISARQYTIYPLFQKPIAYIVHCRESTLCFQKI